MTIDDLPDDSPQVRWPDAVPLHHDHVRRPVTQRDPCRAVGTDGMNMCRAVVIRIDNDPVGANREDRRHDNPTYRFFAPRMPGINGRPSAITATPSPRKMESATFFAERGLI